MKTLKEILLVVGLAFLGCSVLCAVVNLLQGIGMPTAAFGYAGLAMVVGHLLLDVMELRSNEEIWDVFRKCVRSDIAATNAKISDILMPGGARKARRDMLATWILAHAVDAMSTDRPDFTKTCRATFRYKFAGKWEQSSVLIPGAVLADNFFAAPNASVQGSNIIDNILKPYSGIIADIVMQGRDWDMFDFDNAGFFYSQTQEETNARDA